MTRYTDADKRKAVDLYLQHGAEHAAEVLGCDRASVYRWLATHNATPIADEKRERHRQATADRHLAKRQAIREQMLDKALDLLARIDEEHLDYRGKDVVPVTWPKAPSGDVQRYVTAVGILIDKYRLEMGETTGRQEHIGLTPIDLELSKIVDEFHRRADTNL